MQPTLVAPATTRPLRVIILGGGFSGTMVAIHLLRQSGFVQVDLVDEALPGRGLAYSTTRDEHLLNVPAIRMSAFGSEPEHFLHWLQAHGMPSADPGLFAPRKLYGTYIQSVLEATARSADSQTKFRHHFSEAVRLSFDGYVASVFLKNGERLEGEKVVLALGNPAPRDFVGRLPGYYSSPWEAGAFANLDPDKSVLLLGAGLTAVDAFLALVSQGHKGEIHVVSRRGKLPHVHAPYRPLPNPFPVPQDVSARGLLKAIRGAVRTAEAEGVDWRAVIDSIRPVTNELWQGLSREDKLRVFRHLKTWWDIHRHRMAPELGAKMHDALARGQLIVHAGRVRQLSAGGEQVNARVDLRTGSPLFLVAGKVINCTGPENDYRDTPNPLIQYLLEAGYAVQGSTGKGLRANAQGELVDSDDRHLDWLLILGPPRFGDLLETVAVPELRKQAEMIANRLLAISREPVEVMPELFMAAGI